MFLTLILLVLAGVLLAHCSGGGGSKSTAPNWAMMMLKEINKYRTPGEEIVYDSAIAAVALSHAKWLQNNQALPDRFYQSAGAGGSTPTQRLTNASVIFITAGETGTYTDASVQGAYAAMNTTMLTDAAYTHVGIGVVP